jgi:hypothetical protein
MPKQPLKLRETHDDSAEADTPPESSSHSQKKKAEPGQFWLQIDRQTKSSYSTFEEAEAAGLIIKRRFSVVQVSVYDKGESTNTLLTLPA